MNRPNFTQKINSYLRTAQQWYLKTPERSLDEAYKAALLIKAMEDEHFNGKKIAPESANYGDSVMAYFQSELKRYLKTARMRLEEFKISRSIVSSANQTITKIARNNGTNTAKDSFAIEGRNNSALVLEKLRFIDEVIGKYLNERPSNLVVTEPQILQFKSPITSVNEEQLPPKKLATKKVAKVDETSVLPRSILGTINRLQVELDPKSEDVVVEKFRSSRLRTLTSFRLLLLFIIVPFLTFQLSKNLIIGPIVDHWRNPNETKIFLNYEMEEKALVELQKFEERLKFENLLLSENEKVAFSPEELENKVKHKAHEIAEEFRNEGANAIKNIFADLLSLGAFAWLIVASRRQIAILKDFMDNVVYGLSDSAKAFIIILFTDIFVGFHSPHGWEVILSNVAEHLGLPENHDFIFLFIATFPVILDTIFKYWIFRYLNRISPSAVATYRNMNE